MKDTDPFATLLFLPSYFASSFVNRVHLGSAADATVPVSRRNQPERSRSATRSRLTTTSTDTASAVSGGSEQLRRGIAAADEDGTGRIRGSASASANASTSATARPIISTTTNASTNASTNAISKTNAIRATSRVVHDLTSASTSSSDSENSSANTGRPSRAKQPSSRDDGQGRSLLHSAAPHETAAAFDVALANLLSTSHDSKPKQVRLRSWLLLILFTIIFIIVCP
jgi:hypothetical protein